MLTPRDYRLLDAAEGYPSEAQRERAASIPLPRAAARAAELELERGDVGNDLAELENSFRAVLAAVPLTGDWYTDRVALDRAAAAHAKTITGWYADVIEDAAESAIKAILPLPVRS